MEAGWEDRRAGEKRKRVEEIADETISDVGGASRCIAKELWEPISSDQWLKF